jgi:ankyrin repeat protein
MKKVILIIVLIIIFLSESILAYDYSILEPDLIEIIDAGNKQALITSINQGADLNKQNELGITPLIRAVDGNNTKFFKILLSAGADLSLADIGGITPIHIAARSGNMEILILCIRNKADLNIRDIEDWTPLMHAAINANAGAIRALILAGADIEMLDRNENSALVYAVMSNSVATVREIVRVKQNIISAQQEKARNYARSKKIINLLDTIIQHDSDYIDSDKYSSDEYKEEVSEEVSEEVTEIQEQEQWQYVIYLGSFRATEGAYKYWQENIKDIISYGHSLPAIVNSHDKVSRLYIGFFSQQELAEDICNILTRDNKPCKVLKSLVKGSG